MCGTYMWAVERRIAELMQAQHGVAQRLSSHLGSRVCLLYNHFFTFFTFAIFYPSSEIQNKTMYNVVTLHGGWSTLAAPSSLVSFAADASPSLTHTCVISVPASTVTGGELSDLGATGESKLP